MTQVFDMKRLHMGCGESLRRQLPLLGYNKIRRLPSPQAVSDREGVEERVISKLERNTSR
jgi:hypothetical protein